MPVERGVRLLDNRPHIRIGGCFAGKVSRVELRERRIDVFQIEDDVRRDSSVGIDLDDMRTWFDRPAATTLQINAAPGVDPRRLLAAVPRAHPDVAGG